MLKNYNSLDELDKETLASDMEFIEDASLFLQERQGITEAMTPSEVYERFMEHMRYQDVNEVTAIRDLEYAQGADLEGKQRFGRLIDAYDKVNEDISGRMMWDYAEGILTAPSTYLGIVSGGTGKAAAVAGTQAAKLGVRKLLAEGLKSAGKAAVVEGAIGLGQGAVQETTRVETGVQEEFTGGRTAMTGLGAAAGAGLINLPIGAFTAKKASKANELFEKAQLAASEKANQASAKSAEVLQQAGEQKVDEVRQVLNALDPTKVKEGRRLKQDLMPGDTMEAALGADAFNNIAAAAIQVKDKLNLQEGERITSAMQRLIADGKELELDEINVILREHNLNLDQFSLIYLAEVSDAGRTLGSQAQIQKALGGRKIKTEVGKLMDEIDELNQGGVSPITRDDVKALNKGKSYVKDLDKLRLGLMTSQLATTMRNNIGGGFRVGVDAATRMFDNILNLRNPFDGTFDVAKYMLNPYEGKVIQRLMNENFPTEAARLFREAADLQAAVPSETALAKIGRKANFLNTASDNIFKRAVLSASLKRRLSDAGFDLHKVIEDGDFGQISDDILKDAMQDAYEFTYQASMKGDDWFSKMARGTIKAHQEAPFIVSSLIPFPRYIANQMKFVYEHAPLIGLLPIDRLGSRLPARTTKEYLKDKMPKQMTGALMLTAAYQWRVQQGDTAYWYEIQDGKGDYIDGRPVYGPFAPFMLAADLMYRYQRGTMPNSINTYVRDTTQALLGSTFRAGTGLYMLDKLYTDIYSGEPQKAAAETIGNIINTFTLPAAVVKDFYGQFDPESRQIPETRLGGNDNFFDIIYRRATRSLPDFPLNGYDTAAVSPVETGTLSAINPMEKQVFGMGKREKNEFQKEMARLNFTPYDLYKREKNDTLDFYTRQELSRDGGYLNLEQRMTKFISQPEYKSLSIAEQRDKLQREARSIISEAKDFARSRIETDAARRDLPYTELDKLAWNQTTRTLRDRIDAEYQRDFGGRSVSQDEDMFIEMNGKYVNVMRWAVDRANQLSGTGGDM